MDEAALERLLLTSPSSLGSMSIGTPNAGALFNGQQLTEDNYFKPVDSSNAWGTSDTLAYLRAAVAEVHRLFANSPQLYVGHISARRGGRLSPHQSHQSGRDVDIAYYYVDENRWYRRATPNNLDFPRTWAFVRALVTETDVEMILMDGYLSKALWQYATRLGEDTKWLASIFEHAGSSRAIVRHERGHATHMHLRFHNPRAQRVARRTYPLLIRHELIDKIDVYRYHRVIKGETLGKLAKQYGTTVHAIKRANGLRTTVIQSKKLYKIPTQSALWYADTPVDAPPRRLPPSEAVRPQESKSPAALPDHGG